MQPYRVHTEQHGRRVVSFGDERHRALLTVVSLLLVSLTAGSIVAWFFLGGGIRGSILIPAIIGIVLLFRRRGGSVEYVHDRQELRIEFRSLVRRREVRVPVGDIAGLTIMSSNRKDARAEHDLCLLTKQRQPIQLLRSSDAARLEPARAVVSTFLLEQGLVQGDLKVGPTTRIRVEPEREAEAATFDASSAAEPADDQKKKRVS